MRRDRLRRITWRRRLRVWLIERPIMRRGWWSRRNIIIIAIIVGVRNAARASPPLTRTPSPPPYTPPPNTNPPNQNHKNSTPINPQWFSNSTNNQPIRNHKSLKEWYIISSLWVRLLLRGLIRHCFCRMIGGRVRWGRGDNGRKSVWMWLIRRILWRIWRGAWGRLWFKGGRRWKRKFMIVLLMVLLK